MEMTTIPLEDGWACVALGTAGDLIWYGITSADGEALDAMMSAYAENSFTPRAVWLLGERSTNIHVYTEDPWYVDHTRAYAMTEDTWNRIQEGEIVLGKQDGAPYSIDEISHPDSIAQDAYCGLGIDYLGAGFFHSGEVAQVVGDDFGGADVILTIGIVD